MQKQTLLFSNLGQLCTFAKTLQGGYFLNTANLTLTGPFDVLQINMAVELYNAQVIPTCDKVYSYNPLATASTEQLQ